MGVPGDYTIRLDSIKISSRGVVHIVTLAEGVQMLQ